MTIVTTILRGYMSPGNAAINACVQGNSWDATDLANEISLEIRLAREEQGVRMERGAGSGEKRDKELRLMVRELRLVCAIIEIELTE